jgi:hypothetical protein
VRVCALLLKAPLSVSVRWSLFSAAVRRDFQASTKRASHQPCSIDSSWFERFWSVGRAKTGRS